MMALNSYLSKVTLNVNSPNAPMKWHRVSDWIKRQDHLYAAYDRLILNLKTPRD